MATILVPGRYASTRFPGKILADIGGKPMIVRVAEQCLKTKAAAVIVVTDSEKVFKIVESYGIKAVMSSPDIPTGTDRIATVAKTLDDDIIINVQGDEPFIQPELVNELIDQLEADSTLLMNTACVEFAPEDDAKNPSHVKAVLDKNNCALYFSRAEIPFNRDNTQVKRYKHIGIYGFKRDFLLKYASMDKTPLENAEMLEQLRALENGIKIKAVITDYRPLSVDTAEDLELALEYYNNSIKRK